MAENKHDLMLITEVAEQLRVSRATINRMLVKVPEFPKPIRVSERRIAWHRGAIEAWLSARLGASAA